jgi:hypothetical protein
MRNGTEFVSFRIWTDVNLLSTLFWTFGFHKSVVFLDQLSCFYLKDVSSVLRQ